MSSAEVAVKKALIAEELSSPIKCASIGSKGDYVILIHGIRKTSLSMMRIAHELNKEEYCVVNFGYTAKDTVDTISNSLLPKFIKEFCIDPKKKINFVTHSAGGIILRRYLEKNSPLQLGRAVMIAPPNHGSEIADFSKKHLTSIYKFIYGPLGRQLGALSDSYINKILKQSVNFELGIIAGRVSHNPLSLFLIKGPNDGMVSVKSTKVRGMKEHVVLPLSHYFILFSKDTTQRVVSFLKIGKF